MVSALRRLPAQIGMNMNLYGHDRVNGLMVDLWRVFNER